MNFATIKAFVKKHTQSPEEYITEFDVEEMNEWLETHRASDVEKMKSHNITIRFVKGGDTEGDGWPNTNNFWMVLTPENSRFSIRKFAEGAQNAKDLVATAVAYAPILQHIHARIENAYSEQEALFLHTNGFAASYSTFAFEDWVVDIKISHDGESHQPMTTTGEVDAFYRCVKNGSVIYQDPDSIDSFGSESFLQKIEELCSLQNYYDQFVNKDFVATALKSGVTATPIEFSVGYWDTEGYTTFAGYQLGNGYGITVVAGQGDTLLGAVAVEHINEDGRYLPLPHECHIRLLDDGDLYIGSGVVDLTLPCDDESFVCELRDVFTFNLSDTDLNLKAGSIAWMLQAGQSPQEILGYALSGMQKVESYDFDFSMADQASSSGLSL